MAEEKRSPSLLRKIADDLSVARGRAMEGKRMRSEDIYVMAAASHELRRIARDE